MSPVGRIARLAPPGGRALGHARSSRNPGPPSPGSRLPQGRVPGLPMGRVHSPSSQEPSVLRRCRPRPASLGPRGQDPCAPSRLIPCLLSPGLVSPGLLSPGLLSPGWRRRISGTCRIQLTRLLTVRRVRRGRRFRVSQPNRPQLPRPQQPRLLRTKQHRRLSLARTSRPAVDPPGPAATARARVLPTGTVRRDEMHDAMQVPRSPGRSRSVLLHVLSRLDSLALARSHLWPSRLSPRRRRHWPK
jgi:hypothetical protein